MKDGDNDGGFKKDDVVAAGGVASPRGNYVELRLGRCFFPAGSLCAAPGEDLLSYRSGLGIEAVDVVVRFSSVGDALSLDLSTISLKSPCGAVMAPAGAKHRAAVADTVGRSVRLMLEASRRVEEEKREGGGHDWKESADKMADGLVDLVSEHLLDGGDAEILTRIFEILFQSYERRKRNRRHRAGE